MAEGKSMMDISKSEKYMDDALSSIFSNLYKAAKRKNDYIWSTNKFNSLDSIWGDSTETGSSKQVGDHGASNTNKTPRCDLKSSQQKCNISTKTSSSQQNEINQKSNQIQAKMKSDDIRNTGVTNPLQTSYEQNPRSPLFANFFSEEKKSEIYLRNEPKQPDLITENKTINVKASNWNDYEISLNTNKVLENRKAREIHKENPEIDCKISNRIYERDRETFQVTQNSHIKTENHTKMPLKSTKQTTRLTETRNSTVTIRNIKSSIEENEIRNLKSEKIDLKAPLKLKRSPRKRHYLSSSANSILPVSRPPLEQKHNTMCSENDILKNMVQLKIFKCDKMFDFVLKLSDFKQIIKRFPKLQEVLPEIDEEEKELDYSADAIKIVLGFLIHLRYDTSDERVAVEVLAASKSWGISQFHNEFQQQFLKKLNKNNVNLPYEAAVHYGLAEICDAYKNAFGDMETKNRQYRQRKCFISVSTYIEPLEVLIPYKAATFTLEDNFDRDITNEITFKSIIGSYVITGFQILFNLSDKKDTVDKNLEFFYTVSNLQTDYEESLTISKPFRSNIVIYLQKNLIVHQDQKAEITIGTSVRPFLCFAIQENSIVRRCDGNQFCLVMSSHYKVINSNERRFFIGKLLYYPMA